MLRFVPNLLEKNRRISRYGESFFMQSWYEDKVPRSVRVQNAQVIYFWTLSLNLFSNIKLIVTS